MRCPFCGEPDTKVLDSRPAEAGSVIRRRRECGGCGRRFTTYERVEEQPLFVVKRDGRRERFDRQKILTGLVKACEKRPVPLATLEALAEGVERDVRNTLLEEVPSTTIGDLVMARLRKLDEVAYVRFASVYRRFTDVERFREELESLLGRQKKEGD
ncbi:MAG TPA: transcriptional repressor NrdR [Firmicutes bacterium]|jgi:transcriptional repressor NrdR|uniref:transcriptional regulator NrdR n=1 Tax=Gelria sp. Kuro-4 TaxID=2796927 RepID=UPI0019CAE52B|nr:transcriptional regulator NrdR [Gelria sp. Kuro-4]MDI3522343.1 transcriptional repressor NrdR [Bacillota bacterium]MDK2926505.1 transcriptional repressor NrdR [Bacillota bacterium]BCV25663.1 transcriptional repressor NrdR [Gelria sp. Kuro-4]HHV58153.1 transcriptional repressor NrdR [Bacillota bacterium]